MNYIAELYLLEWKLMEIIVYKWTQVHGTVDTVH